MFVRDIVCSCDEIILKSQDGVTKIRSKILVVKGNTVYAVCKRCSQDVKVPLRLDMTNPPLIIKS